MSAKKPKKPKATKPKRKRPRRVRAAAIDPQTAALVAAVIDAPLDPLPRMVLGDHLQSLGHRLGDWVALAAGLEADPNNVRLRAASVAFVDDHRDALFGEGAELLAGAWVGWRGGFIDELRLQPYPNMTRGPARVAALLAHPSCRFVRRIAIGDFSSVTGRRVAPIIAAVANAAPPLLEEVVAIDSDSWSRPWPSFDAIAALPTLRRIGLKSVEITRPMPHVTELVLSGYGSFAPYLADGGCPAVEELVLDSYDVAPVHLLAIVTAMPKLRRLRILGQAGVGEHLVALRPHLARLELLDVSHSRFADADAALLDGYRELELVAIRTSATRAPDGVRAATVTHPWAGTLQREREDPEQTTWIPHRIATGGRDAVRLIPGVGSPLYGLGTHLSLAKREAEALPLLEAALTFPLANHETRPWANVAIAHERLYHFDEAELVGREGLLRAPFEPNFFAIVIDALRRSDRLAEAEAMLPRAFDALDRPDEMRHSKGSAAACLLDCLFTLAQAGRHAEVIAAAKRYPKAMKPDCYPVVAMSHVALGKPRSAHAAMKKAKAATHAVVHHAHAVFALAEPMPNHATVMAEIDELRRLRYPELHWLPRDPLLAAIREDLL